MVVSQVVLRAVFLFILLRIGKFVFLLTADKQSTKLMLHPSVWGVVSLMRSFMLLRFFRLFGLYGSLAAWFMTETCSKADGGNVWGRCYRLPGWKHALLLWLLWSKITYLRGDVNCVPHSLSVVVVSGELFSGSDARNYGQS